MAVSTLKTGRAYGQWHWEGDVQQTHEEVLDCFFAHEFWQDRTRGNLNRKGMTPSWLWSLLDEYYLDLMQSVHELELLGLTMEPSDDDSAWRGLEYT